MEDSSGFYRINSQGDLEYAPNFFYAPTYCVKRSLKDTYNYPVHGWYWFNSLQIACESFNIPVPDQQPLK